MVLTGTLLSYAANCRYSALILAPNMQNVAILKSHKRLELNIFFDTILPAYTMAASEL